MIYIKIIGKIGERENSMKVNYLGIIAGTIVLACLFFPWFTVTTTQTASTGATNTIEFKVYLYQLSTTVNGVQQTTPVNVWLGLSTLVLLIVTGIGCLIGSLRDGKKGRLILVFTGILALISVMTFGLNLQNNIFSAESIIPGYTTSLFQTGTASIATDLAYSYSWQMASGFWVALFAGVLNLVSLPTHPMRQMLMQRPLERQLTRSKKEETN